MLYFSVILATLCIQIPNIWAIRVFNEHPSLASAFWIALWCLPASFMATAMYSYYYGKGYEALSYPVMTVTAYGVGLLTSLAVQVLVLKAKTPATPEVVGAAFIVVGIGIIVTLKS